jgi:hypothetical protein
MKVSSKQMTVSSKSTGANRMSKVIFICLLLTVFPGTVNSTEAQQLRKVFRIG